MDEFDFLAFFLVLRCILVDFLITINARSLSGCGAPLDELRGEHLETGVTEHKLESFIQACQVSDDRVRAADAPILNSLLKLFLLNLVHERDPALPCLEAV